MLLSVPHTCNLSRSLKDEGQGLLEVLTAASEELLLREKLLHNAEKEEKGHVFFPLTGCHCGSAP